MKIPFRICLFILCFSSAAFAQKPVDKKKLIQFSGVVVSGDSLQPIPFASIMIRDSYHGTVSDYYGFFSFVAEEGSVIEFAAIGFKNATYVIPDTLKENKCSLIQVLQGDTVYLRQAIVYPWPTREQFKQAFLNLNVPDDNLSRARKNLSPDIMLYLARNTSMDGRENQKNYMQQVNSKLYYAGQLPPNNLLNPIAWSKFIKAWQNGELKIEK
jgi:hypothetical protein